MIDLKEFFVRFRMPLTLFAALLFVATAVSAQATASSTQQQSGRLVTIHDQGVEKVIVTKARTVGDALKKAKISVDSLDAVEPAVNTELVANNYNVNVYRARPVTIVDGEARIRVMTPHQSARQIARDANMKLYDEDETTLGRIDNVLEGGAGLKLTIDRATPFTLKLYGKTISARTQSETVAEMLKEKNITLGPKDSLSVKPSVSISKGMKVEIWRNGKQTINEDQAIAFPVERIEDVDREVGYRSVKTPGEAGQRTVTYEVIMKNGKEIARKEIQSVVVKQPKKQVEVVGAKIEGPEQIISKIRAVASTKGIDARRVLLIAQCESGFNPRSDSGYYKGLFQHDPSYWASRATRYGYPGASYFDVNAQIGVSTSMMAEGGWSHWGCDPGPQ